jgi:hypothetical protein
MPTWKDVFDTPGNPTIPCGLCKRRVPADMLFDIRHIPAQDRPRGAPFVCDACAWRIANGLVKLRDQTGAP